MLSTTYQRKYGGYDKFTAFRDRVDVGGINSTDVEVIGVLPESKYTVTTDLYFQLVDGSTRFLAPGDELVSSIEGIGTIRHPPRR